MKILIVSDAGKPQINGVVRSIEMTVRELTVLGHKVHVVEPNLKSVFAFPLPFYPEITLELFARRRLAVLLESFQPHAIHLATEGPLGWAMRNLCLKQKRPFTTSFHTRFPEYIARRLPRFLATPAHHIAVALLRVFHKPSCAVYSATSHLDAVLRAYGITNIVRWSRGVDIGLFRPRAKDYPAFAALPRPILLSVGRVAVEKNLPAFLVLETPGSKVVIGDGPDLDILRARFPQVHFLGALTGEALARAYASADLFVFPSRTDTFGLVLLEAAASGLRIAAYPVTGPADIFPTPEARCAVALDQDLAIAIKTALALPDNPDIARAQVLRYSWKACTGQFVAHLHPVT